MITYMMQSIDPRLNFEEGTVEVFGENLQASGHAHIVVKEKAYARKEWCYCHVTEIDGKI